MVHCKREPHDVYIGRGSIWGNPASHKKGTKAKIIVPTREDAVKYFLEYILVTPELLGRLPELKDKTLGCWCKPKLCHGDVIVYLINTLTAKGLM